METDDLTGRIIGCAIEVHRQLGRGLWSPRQESALAVELEFARFHLERQVSGRIQYLQTAGSITGWRSSLL